MSMLSALRREAAVAVCGVVITIGVASSPALAAYSTADVPVGSYPIGVAVDQATDDTYVTNSADDSVSVISGSTGTVTDTVAVGTYPQGIEVDASLANTIYVANAAGNSVLVINGNNNYYWIATYGGDQNNNGTVTSCGAAPITVQLLRT